MCCAESLFARCYQTAEECQVFLAIWFISVGKTTSVGWNPIMEFCSCTIWDVRWKLRRGWKLRRNSILSENISLPQTFPLLIALFLLPPCCVSLPLLHDGWLCHAWLTSIFLSFWFIELSHNHLSSQIVAFYFSPDEVFVKRLDCFPVLFCLYYDFMYHRKLD